MPPAKVKRRRKKKHPFKVIWRWLKAILRRLFMPLVIIFAAGAAYLWYDLPDISKFGDFKKTPSIIVKAEDGTILGTYGDVYGDYVSYDQLPKYVIQAVVATEDRNFFWHFGVDPLGLMRATYVNLRAHHVVQGGSTITQQLAKNVFLTPARTFKRKLQEMVLAFELERRFTKQQILTLYLNRVYMGAGNYGVDAASRRYFGHSVRNISLNEAAILVGLLKAPSRYAPTSNPDLSERRATQVLENMVDAHYLSQKEADAAKADFGNDDEATYRDSHGFGSFYFSDWVVGQIPEYTNTEGAPQEDIIVSTTLNTEWQHLAEDAVSKVMDEKGKNMNASQAALMAMTPSGEIKAMVGGRNYRASQFNRVTQALRQPGSSFKLFVYLAGLEAGFTPESTMEDKPIDVGNWHPRDYTGKYLGMMTLTEAFAQSINSIAVQLSETTGRSRVVDMARRLGISSDMNPDPSIALGTNEVTLFDMTKAYAHVAAGGESVYPFAIKKIENSAGKVLYQRNGTGGGRELTREVVEMMNHMLLAVTTIGTGRAATIGRPVAGKTGTTSDYRDAWFIGFTPQLVAGVWVGNDDTHPMKKVTGGSLPASIWHSFMIEAMKKFPVTAIPESTGSGGGILPWLFQGPATSLTPGSPSPKEMQNMQGGAVPSQTHNERTPIDGPVPAVNHNRRPVEEHEEEPTPSYNAPSGFWDSLTGNRGQ
jgi:penicillin-binding protein 1A